MKDNFNQSNNRITKLLKQAKEEFLLTHKEKLDLKSKIINRIDKLNTSVTKPDNKRYNIWSYQLNFRGVVMPLIPFIIALAIAIGAGTVVSADNANPGDTLYGLDQFMENFQEKFPMSESRKARFLSRLSEERALELLELRNIDPEALTEKAQERWEGYHTNAVDRLAISVEKLEAFTVKFEEKLVSADSEDQKEAFQKKLDYLATAKERTETKLTEIEDQEFLGLGSMHFKGMNDKFYGWKKAFSEKRSEYNKEMSDELKEAIEAKKAAFIEIKESYKDKDDDSEENGSDDNDNDEDTEDEEDEDEETDTNNNTI